MQDLLGLSEFNWKALHHEQGSAEDLPMIFGDFLSASSAEEAAGAVFSLAERVCYAGQEIFEATTPTVKVMWRIAAAEYFEWRHFAIQFIDAVASVDGLFHRRSEGDEYIDSCRGAIEDGLHIPWSLIDDSSVDLRGSSIEILGDTAPSDVIVPVLLKSLREERDSVLCADISAALVSSLMRAEGEGGTEARKYAEGFLSEGSSLVRFRVAQLLAGTRPSWISEKCLDSIIGSAYREVVASGVYRSEYA
ncbi:hypothetical protein ACFQ08_02150 [Streptosporangium algeriense]|uniref:HEAT repeat domain-containing protein n=1 Tax=Streptosporangium algeriense TaxID=1682748 RepID=A0ABW3DKE0_9ACTN